MFSFLLLVACSSCQQDSPAAASTQASTALPQSAGFRGNEAQDAIAYTIDLHVLPGGEFEGSIAYHFRALEDLQSIVLDAATGDEWELQFFNASGEGIHIEQNDFAIRVPLDPIAPAGSDIFFSATFSGTPADGLYRDRNRYGATYLFTDHFTDHARGWMPCEDSNADRAQFDLTLHVPPGWDAVGSGDWKKLPSVKGAAPGASFRGVTVSDISPSLFAFAAGPFLRVVESGDSRIQPHFVFPEDMERAAIGLVHHSEWMATMEKTFGPYQYAKFTTVQIPTRWGGMEYPGNVWLAQNLFDYPDAGVGTLAHEFTHMWFGDGVGYAQWEDAWLSEGFASYFGPWLHEQVGGPSLRSAMEGNRVRWLRSKFARDTPVRWKDYRRPNDFFSRVAANTYQKGSWVLHMLRQEIGEDAFFAGIKTYYQDHLGQAVVSSAFIEAMESAAGRDLDWFFDQWLERAGAPVLELEDIDGSLVLRQTQAGPLFRFKLRVGWTDADGQPAQGVFEITQRETTLPLGASTRDWKLDPRVELLFQRAR
ncbi:MAG: M1 family aminopeptidase [Planctomycetota bacterium]